MAPYLFKPEPQSELTLSQLANGPDGDSWLTFDVIMGRVIDALAMIGAFTVVLFLMLWIVS